MNWKLTVIVIVLTPLVMLWSRAMTPLVEKYQKKTRESDSEVRAYAQEVLANPIVVRAFQMHKAVDVRFSQLFSAFAANNIRKTLVSSVLNSVGSILGFSSFLVSITVGTMFVLRGEMTVGAIAGFVQLLNYIVWPFTGGVGQLGEIKTACVSKEAACARKPL